MRPLLNIQVNKFKDMTRLKAILKLLCSKEYHLLIVNRDGPMITEEIYSSLRNTETTYKKLIKELKENLEILRRYKHEQGGFD